METAVCFHRDLQNTSWLCFGKPAAVFLPMNAQKHESSCRSHGAGTGWPQRSQAGSGAGSSTSWADAPGITQDYTEDRAHEAVSMALLHLIKD